MAWMPPVASRSTHLSMKEQPPHIWSAPTAETAAFFLRSSDYPQGAIFHVARPEDISLTPPAIKRPPSAEMRQAALQMIRPCVFFVQYPCLQKCRSLGICIHYQFVAGCR